MALFIPRTQAYWTRAGSLDQYGQTVPGTRTPVKVGVVKFIDEVIQTPLRMEMSASHGRLDEDIAKAVVLLFPATCTIVAGDMVEIFGINLAVIGVWPQQDILGRLQHKRVSLTRDR